MGLCRNGEERIIRIEKEVGGRNKDKGGRGEGQSVVVYQVFVLMLHSFHKKNMRAFLLSLCSEASNIEMLSLSQLLNSVKCLIMAYFWMKEQLFSVCSMHVYQFPKLYFKLHLN